MLAADTNVLVRLLVSDDLAQQAVVRRRLDRANTEGEAVLVTPVALAETAWVLDAVYGYGRKQIFGAVRAVLNTPPFLCPERQDVLRALQLCDAGSADFPDYLILALSESGGATTLLTFDRKLLRHPRCQKP